MFEKINALKNKKGFTLVELIVVLLILAILAALLIPALTGYIDKAKGKTAVAEARAVVMAAQTLVDELYAANKATIEIVSGASIPAEGKVGTDEILDLAETSGTIEGKPTIDKGQITVLVYKNGKTVTYNSGETGSAKFKLS